MINESNYTQYEAINKNHRSRNGSRNGFTYEHFPVVCPTCEGAGEIEEDSSGMVTFVPVADERLKPTWTKGKVAMSLFLILALAGLITFFVYPRDVKIFVDAHDVQDFNFKTKIPWILYGFTMNVNNKNFLPIKLHNITMTMFYMGKFVKSHGNTRGTVSVGIRAVKEMQVTMNISYEGDLAKSILKQCYKERYYVPQLMQSTAEMSYLIHNEHIESKDDYFYTDCSSMVFPLPTSTTTTTKKTTALSTHPPTTSSDVHGKHNVDIGGDKNVIEYDKKIVPVNIVD